MNVLSLELSSRSPQWRDARPSSRREGPGFGNPTLSNAFFDPSHSLDSRHPRFVFTYEGNPIGQVGTKAWTKALKRAGIKDFRWHDLRHTWASWLTQNGVPLNALQEMGAWQSSEMVRRYAHLAPEQVHPACTGGGSVVG